MTRSLPLMSASYGSDPTQRLGLPFPFPPYICPVQAQYERAYSSAGYRAVPAEQYNSNTRRWGGIFTAGMQIIRDDDRCSLLIKSRHTISSGKLRCEKESKIAYTQCCAGPNELQVAAFRTQLSEPTALKSHFSYRYSASLISDGLANGTDPVYVYPMPRCTPLSSLIKSMPQCLHAVGTVLPFSAPPSQSEPPGKAGFLGDITYIWPAIIQFNTFSQLLSGMAGTCSPLRFLSCMAMHQVTCDICASTCGLCDLFNLHAMQVCCHCQCARGCCGSSAVCGGLQPQSSSVGRWASARWNRPA